MPINDERYKEINAERTRRLNEAIQQSGLTYAELAELTGSSKSSLQRYATGAISKVPINVLEAIAEIVHVSPMYLLCWDTPENEKTALTNDEDDLISFTKELKLRGDELVKIKSFAKFVVSQRSQEE